MRNVRIKQQLYPACSVRDLHIYWFVTQRTSETLRGISNFGRLMVKFNIWKPFAEKLKYWDCNEGKKVNFENGPVK